MEIRNYFVFSPITYRPFLLPTVQLFQMARNIDVIEATDIAGPWKKVSNNRHVTHYLSRIDHERKNWSRRQRTDTGKYSFVNRTIQHWNQLPAEVLGILPCKPITFKKRVRKVIIELN